MAVADLSAQVAAEKEKSAKAEQVANENAKGSVDEQKKHQDFVERMISKGYTEKQVRLLCDWYLRVRKSS